MTRRLLPVALLLGLLATGCSAGRDRDDALRIKQAHIHYEMGIDALRKGNIPIAFRELMRAQSYQPNDAEILAALALAWRYRGDLKRSRALYERALAIHPTPAMHNNYGSLLLQMGDPKGAEKQFRIALDDPRYPRQELAFINLGDALTAQRRFDQAINAYRQATMINPRQTISILREAAAFVASGRKPYAEALLLTTLRRRPALKEAVAAVLPLLREHHATREALALLARYRRAVGSRPEEEGWAREMEKRVRRWDR